MEKGFTQDRMEYTPIPQLVVKGSVPLMISTLVSSMYGIVDSMFVARISEKALTATTIAFPITLFLFAIAIGTAMGVNSRLARFLGEGEFKDAKETAWTGILLAIISSIPFVLIGMFGFPALGIEGAAIATVLSQCVSGVMSTTLYFVKNPHLRLKKENLPMRVDLVGEIYKVGVPMMIVTALNSVMMVLTNRILEGVSSTAIAFYGVFGKLQNFMFMPVNGLSQGIVPIVGYFYGAKNGNKIRETTKFALKIGTSVMLVGTIVFFICPVLLMTIFSAGEAMLEIGRVGLRVLAISFIPHGFILVLGNVFTALGNGMLNMKCSMIRGALPIILLLPLIKIVGTTWCWFAFVIADFIAAALAIYSYVRMDRERLKELTGNR